MAVLGSGIIRAGGGIPVPFDKVILLMHFDGSDGSTGFTDVKGNIFTGSAIISTNRFKFNGASGLFIPNSDISTPNNSTLNFSSSSVFAIQAWIYRLSSGSTHVICGNLPQILSRGWSFQVRDNDTLGFGSDGGVPNIDSGLNVPINQWVYVALSKSYTSVPELKITYTFAVNSDISAIVDNTTWASSPNSRLYIGQNGRNDIYSSFFNGNMDELRIAAQPIDVLKVPTQPFPNQ